MRDLHAASDLDREKPRVLEELANMFGRIPSLGVSNLARELGAS
jgi:zinc protease